MDLVLEALLQTMAMVIPSTFFAVVIGFFPAILVTLTAPDGLAPNKIVYKSLDFIINTLRSFPFIILMVVLVPLTRVIMGGSIGVEGAIVPLTVATAPFVARIIENALREVDKGVIEAAKAFGASNKQILFKVMLVEAVPAIVSGLTLTIISVIGYSAMAGAIGGGGLGDVAIRYGYHRNEYEIMWATVIVLVIVVQVLQSLGNYLYKKLSR
ncbi:MAG: methionine ABC transporter permease [Clostridium sp.]